MADQITEKKTIIYTTPESSGRVLAQRIVYYLVDILEVLLAVRFILKAFGANAASGFVNFIYTLTGSFVAPFRGIFAATGNGGVVIEWATLIAMLIYALLGYAIVRLIQVITNS